MKLFEITSFFLYIDTNCCSTIFLIIFNSYFWIEIWNNKEADMEGVLKWDHPPLIIEEKHGHHVTLMLPSAFSVSDPILWFLVLYFQKKKLTRMETAVHGLESIIREYAHLFLYSFQVQFTLNLLICTFTWLNKYKISSRYIDALMRWCLDGNGESSWRLEGAKSSKILRVYLDGKKISVKITLFGLVIKNYVRLMISQKIWKEY
jgi:hypothetical protein